MTIEQQTEAGETERSEPDYAAIEVPADTPPSDLHYTHRRAEVLKAVEEAGHPAAVSQKQLADYYGVSQSTISRDLDRIDQYLRENIGGRRDLESHSVYRRAVRGLLENDDYREAARVQRWHDEWRNARLDTIQFRKRIDRLEEAAEREGDR